jgi:hypothetical protein
MVSGLVWDREIYLLEYLKFFDQIIAYVPLFPSQSFSHLTFYQFEAIDKNILGGPSVPRMAGLVGRTVSETDDLCFSLI